jgi:hypothetical protein
MKHVWSARDIEWRVSWTKYVDTHISFRTSLGSLRQWPFLAGTRGGVHRRSDPAEDFAYTDRDVGHDCSGGNRHETGYQCILDEILAKNIGPDFHFQQ